MIALSSSCTSRDYDLSLGIDDCGGDPRPRLTSFTAWTQSPMKMTSANIFFQEFEIIEGFNIGHAPGAGCGKIQALVRE